MQNVELFIKYVRDVVMGVCPRVRAQPSVLAGPAEILAGPAEILAGPTRKNSGNSRYFPGPTNIVFFDENSRVNKCLLRFW